MSQGSDSATFAPHVLTESAANQSAPLAQMAVIILQGRFSGRLQKKSDEERLPTECAALGPLLGGVANSEFSERQPGLSQALNSTAFAAWIACGDRTQMHCVLPASHCWKPTFRFATTLGLVLPDP